jgi:serine O-acetyltransferase
MSLLSTLAADAARLIGNPSNTLSLLRLTVTSVPFRAVLLYRLSAALYSRIPALGRILHQVNILAHGADIDPRCQIGSGLLLQHPIGTVIGGGASLGENCTLMGGVVLGRKEVRGGESPLQYPQLGASVLIGSGACILGRVNIGDHAIVGAMALVLRDVPAHSVAVGNPAESRPSKPENKKAIRGYDR